MSKEAYRVPVTAAQIARACRGRLVRGPAGAAARGVSTDSRAIRPGEAFFALKGPTYDGHAYLPQAVAAGASVLVVQRLAPMPLARHTPVVEAPDTSRALLELAAWHRRRLRATLLAVTGSWGKSTVKDMIGAILSEAGGCCVAPASFNNRIGVAKTLLSAAPDDDFVVTEMGTNHPGEIAELAAAAKPDIGLITSIGEVHLEGLGNLEAVREAKAELIAHLPQSGALALNADDERCASLAGRFEGRVHTFGLNAGADERPTRIRRDRTGWAFDALGTRFRLPGAARYNLLNAAAALCAARAAGADLQGAARALSSFAPAALRYEKRDVGGVLFVLDCYNSNPGALRAAVRSFVLESSPGRKILLCGDMLELGPLAAELHRRLGAELARSPIDALITVGPLSRHLKDAWSAGCDRPSLSFYSAEDAVEPLLEMLRPGDAALVKGSRALRMETIVEQIAARLANDQTEKAA